MTTTNTPPVTTTNTPPVVTTNTTPSTPTNVVETPSNTVPSALVNWVDDAIPGGGVAMSNGDAWTWTSSNPAPFSGNTAHRSPLKAGLHEHYFNWASDTLSVSTGDTMFAYIYLDAANPPTELMLHWNDGSWDHRAYWGANRISYGTDGTAGRRYMGPLPQAGQWVRLDVPARQVNLEGSTVKGMTFSLYDGQATWDTAGKFSGFTTPSTNTPPVSTTNTPPVTTTNTPPVTTTNTPPTTVTNTPPVTTTNTPPVTTTNTPPVMTNAPASTNLEMSVSVTDYVNLQMPKAGDNTLHILSPTTLELKLINIKQADPARVSTWDFVDSSYKFQAPNTSDLRVLVNGNQVSIQTIGFRRRPFYAPLVTRDLRIENCLFLQLANPIADGQRVEVKNPTANLWPSSKTFAATAEPNRFSPVIHVNQEGYVPSFPKKAMVGYYLGNLGRTVG